MKGGKVCIKHATEHHTQSMTLYQAFNPEFDSFITLNGIKLKHSQHKSTVQKVSSHQ